MINTKVLIIKGLVILVIITCILFITIASLTYMFFWYELFNSDGKLKIALIIKGIVGTFLSLWLTTILYPFNIIIPKTIKIKKHLNKSNIKSAWLYLIFRLLKAKQINNIYIINYNSYLYCFKEIKTQIENQVSHIINTSDDKITLIGHSLGGLFCYALCKNEKIANKIDSIITLGTPYEGSKLAAFGISKLARELRYKGKLVNELKKANIASHIKGFVFYSPIDNLVLPSSSLKSPEPSWKEIITKPVNHVAMLYNRDIINKIIKIITNY